MSGNHLGLKNGWPRLLSASSSTPDDRNVSALIGPSDPAARA